MKRDKIIYWIATGLLTLLMLFSASNYFLKNEMVSGIFVDLGYNARIVIPLAIAKLLGLVAILTKKSQFLKEWAYAGFFFDVALAAEAHLAVGDGNAGGAFIGMVLVVVSYIYDKKLFS